MRYMMKNIAAYTAPDRPYYPEYISINETPEGNVAITVRSPPIILTPIGEDARERSGPIVGNSAYLTMSKSEFSKLLAAAWLNAGFGEVMEG